MDLICSIATIFRKLSLKESNREQSYLEDWSRYTTDEAETKCPLWVPQQQTLIFADALTAPDGDLRIWSTPWHKERVLPALRALLDLPFQHVIVSHGKPVHDRTVFERALRLSPWKE